MATIAIDARILRTTTGRYVERLLHYLQAIDNTNDYIVLLQPKDMDGWQPTSPRFTKVEAPFDQYSFDEQRGFLRLLNELKPDLTHFCMPQQPIGYRGRTVTTVHDLTLLKTYNSDKNWFIFRAKQIVGKYVFNRIGQSSRFIITPSQYTKNDYVRFAKIDPNKVVVTYEGADTGLIEAEPFEPLRDRRYIMYVGNQSDYKNIRRLMHAHQQLRFQHPDLLLVLVGKLSGPNGVSLRRNKEWAEKKNMQGIVFTDFVSDEQLAWLYQHCATYVFPSLMEGFGLPGLEAMSMGAPVASSNATCLPEIYGGAARYFNPTDVNEMCYAIHDLLSNEQLRRTTIERGYEQVHRYSWRRMAEQTLAVYEKALE